jgi:hypothetical protein
LRFQEEDFEQDEEELEEVEDEDSDAQSGDDPFMDEQGVTFGRHEVRIRD